MLEIPWVNIDSDRAKKKWFFIPWISHKCSVLVPIHENVNKWSLSVMKLYSFIVVVEISLLFILLLNCDNFVILWTFTISIFFNKPSMCHTSLMCSFDISMRQTSYISCIGKLTKVSFDLVFNCQLQRMSTFTS